jgi:hypothetical protein
LFAAAFLEYVYSYKATLSDNILGRGADFSLFVAHSSFGRIK